MQLEQRSIPFEKIETNVCGFNNPRTYLGDLTDLVASIEEEGLLVNPTVWETVVKGKTRYVMLLGHRRLAAIQQIRLKAEAEGEEAPFDEVTCSVTDANLESAMSIALIDHIHNETLNPADTAQAVAKLVERTGNQTKVGEMLSKSQPWVSIYLNLYRGLIPDALEALRVGNIRVNQAKRLAALLNQDKTPDVDAQTAELARLLQKDQTESSEQPREPTRKRAKTHRAKKEMEALRIRLTELDKENGEVDAEYRANVSRVVAFYFCQIDEEEVCFSSPDIAAPPKAAQEPAEQPKKRKRRTEEKTEEQKAEEAPTEAAEDLPLPKKRKRRIADVVA